MAYNSHYIQISLSIAITVARVLARTVTKPRTQQTQATDKLLTQPTSHAYVLTVIAKFSHEEIELKKAIVLGIAQVTSEELIAAINDDDSPDNKLRDKQNRTETNSRVDLSFNSI
jgi:hypothetical protein